MSLFGIDERIEQIRVTLVRAFKQKSAAIMALYASKKLEDIPKIDLTRALVLEDIAEVFQSVDLGTTAPPPKATR